MSLCKYIATFVLLSIEMFPLGHSCYPGRSCNFHLVLCRVLILVIAIAVYRCSLILLSRGSGQTKIFADGTKYILDGLLVACHLFMFNE